MVQKGDIKNLNISRCSAIWLTQVQQLQRVGVGLGQLPSGFHHKVWWRAVISSIYSTHPRNGRLDTFDSEGYSVPLGKTTRSVP
jgi:hypothetical protein